MDDNANTNPAPMNPETPASHPRRLFLYENGWRVEMKTGSEREFCYMTAPGQDYYHRLLDGELYLTRSEEKLCFACAERRGLLSYEPRTLRELSRLPVPDSDQEPGPPA